MDFKTLFINYQEARKHTSECPFQNCLMDYAYDDLRAEVNRRLRKKEAV